MPVPPIVRDEVRNHFFQPEPLKRVEAISPLGLMREHWFTAELAYVFSEMEKRGTIKWEPEYPVTPDLRNPPRIDFRLRLLEGSFEKETVAVEVKVMPTRNKDGRPYPIRRLDYAKQNCVGDVQKMTSVPADRYFLLIFAYPAPPSGDWNGLAQNIRNLCKVHTVLPTVSDDSKGEKLSIGWLEVQASTQAVQVGNSLITSSPTSP